MGYVTGHLYANLRPPRRPQSIERPVTRVGRGGIWLACLVAMLALAPAALANATITSTGPLTSIGITSDLNCSVNHSGDTAGEFFGNTACGTFVASGGNHYGPASVPAGPSGNPAYTPVSQSPVTGSGTAPDPYKIVTVVDLGTSGLRLTETDSYVVGSESYQTDVRLANSGSAPAGAIIYRAADCYLQGSDTGYGSVDPSSGAVACVNAVPNPNGTGTIPGTRIEQWYPLTSGSHYVEDGYSTVWSDVTSGTDLPNTCRCSANIDNGAGLSWNVTVPAGGSVTESHLITFSPLGRTPLRTTKTADASTATINGSDGYTITISNPNPSAVSLDSITDTLPAGFSYTTGTSTGGTTADPSVSGQTLTWSGPISVPAASGSTPGTVSLHFGVTVAGSAGTYYNNASAAARGYTVVPTGDTAPITTISTAPPPVVTGVSPGSGPVAGGTTVTITGTDLAGASAVNFGSTPAPSFTVNSAGTSITATAPPGSAGTVDVTVVTPGGTSPTGTADRFTYQAPAPAPTSAPTPPPPPPTPSVTGISPGSGPVAGGTTVTITGTDLTGATSVSFGPNSSVFYSVDAAGTSITAVSPPGSPGPVYVSVTTPGGTSTASGGGVFTYVAAPTVTSVSPGSGPPGGGTTVTITGTDLAGATAVNFGSTPAPSFTVNSAGTSITATAPPGSAGTVDVTVVTPGGTSPTGTADRFTYQAPAPTPTPTPTPPTPSVTGISPGSGPDAGGSPVTITGTGFTGATGVGFGTAAGGSLQVLSDTTITVSSPPGTGTVDVTVTGPGGTSSIGTADQFTYTAALAGAPTVSGQSATPRSSTTEALSAFVNPNGQPTSAHYEYGLDPSLRTTPGPLYDQRTPDQPVGSGTAGVPVSAGLTGLIPHALYHARLVTTSSAGTTYGPELTFTTLADPAPPPPVLGQSADVFPISGQVFVKLPPGDTLYGAAGHSAQANLTKGSGFLPLTEARQIPSGSQIDARTGTLQLVTATSGTGQNTKTQAGIFGGGLFTNSQSASGVTKGLTTLRLLEDIFPGAPSYRSCSSTIGKAFGAHAAKGNPVLQTLHARDSHGRFRTQGRYSAGTVRGTVWDTSDTCAGTLTVVHRGTVAVYDYGTGRTVAVHAGHRYLALAPTRHPKKKK